MHRTPAAFRAADALSTGDRLSIYVPSLSHGRPGEQLVGQVAHATPRAVRVQLEAARGGTRPVWLPRRALVHLVRRGEAVRADLASWFRPDPDQARVLAECGHRIAA